jgi:hypothetical protein
MLNIVYFWAVRNVNNVTEYCQYKFSCYCQTSNTMLTYFLHKAITQPLERLPAPKVQNPLAVFLQDYVIELYKRTEPKISTVHTHNLF